MRSVFLLCLSLYHGTQTIGAQEHPHRHRLRLYHASAYTYQQERHTQPHRQPDRSTPAQCTIGRETARLSGYRGHRLRLYHASGYHRGTGKATDSLSDGYRHNVPSSERQRASAATDSLSLYRWQPDSLSGRIDPHRHRLRLYHASGYHRTASAGARIYTANRNTHSGHTGAHRQPQHMLPAQCTTPTIGTGSAGARTYSEQEHPHRARAYTMHTPSGRNSPRTPLLCIVYTDRPI